ncbi:MAG: hypothetical protein U0625_06660 [Phycisphaerales bacterium]
MRHIALACLAAGIVAGSASAQSFNIDFGNTTPTPGSGFGAAAGQAGVWNTYAGGTLVGLAGLGGGATGVTLTGTGGSLAGYNDPNTFGDDEALIDDGLVIPFLESYSFSGLAAGTYDVYVYTWTFQQLPTAVNVNGSGYTVVGGAWPGGYVQGVTHSLSTVTIAANQALNIDIFTVNGAIGCVTGVQLVQVPAPGAAAVMGALLLRSRRRRS